MGAREVQSYDILYWHWLHRMIKLREEASHCRIERMQKIVRLKEAGHSKGIINPENAHFNLCSHLKKHKHSVDSLHFYIFHPPLTEAVACQVGSLVPQSQKSGTQF